MAVGFPENVKRKTSQQNKSRKQIINIVTEVSYNAGKNRHWTMLTIGFSGMLQSHLVTTLLMIPCSLYVKQREYLPDGTGDDYYQGKHSPLVSDEENVRIDDYIKDEDRVTFTYFLNSDTGDPYIELPMFYYPGYEARLSDWNPAEY